MVLARGELGSRAEDGAAGEADRAPNEAALWLLARIDRLLDRSVPPCCPDCRGELHHRWGRLGEGGNRRWRCRACARTLTIRTGTLLAGLREPAKLRDVALDMFAARPRSCRRLAADLGLDKMTVWTWRRKLAELLTERPGIGSSDGATAIEMLRESRKASREWVNHRRDPHACPEPDRLRWIDHAAGLQPFPDPMTPYLIPVRLNVDWLRVADSVLPSIASLSAVPGSSRDAPARPSGRLAEPAHAPWPAHDAVVRAFRRFISAFRGPATRHLDGYVAWFTARSPASTG